MKTSFCGKTELHHVRKWRQFEAMPSSSSLTTASHRTIPVIYYLCRNGQLQHPHFMEVHIPSSRLLLLGDVVNRFDFLRGRGMAAMYSWSSKRSYKSGFVWQDVTEKDVIHPISGGEYVLKGSELLEIGENRRVYREGVVVQRDGWSRGGKNQWRLDGGDYIVYRNSNGSSVGTQTEEVIHGNRTELRRREELPPSPEHCPEKTAEDGGGSGRIKASGVLRQLISCGSLSTMKNAK